VASSAKAAGAALIVSGWGHSVSQLDIIRARRRGKKIQEVTSYFDPAAVRILWEEH